MRGNESAHLELSVAGTGAEEGLCFGRKESQTRGKLSKEIVLGYLGFSSRLIYLKLSYFLFYVIFYIIKIKLCNSFLEDINVPVNYLNSLNKSRAIPSGQSTPKITVTVSLLLELSLKMLPLLPSSQCQTSQLVNLYFHTYF